MTEYHGTTAGWHDYAEVLKRRQVYWIVPMVSVFLLAVVVSVFLPKVYRSEAMLLVQEEKVVNPLMSGLAETTTIGQRLRGLREELLSWPSMVQLVRQLNLDRGVTSVAEFEELIRQLRLHVDVKMRGSDLIQIAYEGHDPIVAQKIAKTMTDNFIERNTALQQREADTAIEFIQGELDSYKGKLEGSEEALRQFNEVYALQMPVASRLNQQLAQLEFELTNLLIDNTEEHPAVQEVRRKIEAIKAARNEEIQRLAKRSDAQAVDPAKFSVVAESIPRQQQELSRLTRDYEVNEQIYTHLLQKLEKAKISSRLESSDDGTKFTVIDPPRVPTRPVRPNVPKVALFSLLLGAFLGIGLAFMVEYMDQGVWSSEEARELLGVPVLGSVASIITEADVKRQHSQWWRKLQGIKRAWQVPVRWVDAVLGRIGL